MNALMDMSTTNQIHGLPKPESECVENAIVYGRNGRRPKAMTQEMRLLLSSVLLDNGCWEFRGGSRNGTRGQYRRISWDNKLLSVHRLAYEIWVGPIEYGKTVDHVCGLTTCINPRHLRVVSAGENVRAHWHEQRGLCRNKKHELSQSEVWVTHRGRPSRQCRFCYDEKMKRYVRERTVKKRRENGEAPATRGVGDGGGDSGGSVALSPTGDDG